MGSSGTWLDVVPNGARSASWWHVIPSSATRCYEVRSGLSGANRYPVLPSARTWYRVLLRGS